MPLKVERRDGSSERTVLVGMIKSRSVLGQVAAKYKQGMFPSRYGELIASWCITYFKRYNRAPNNDLLGYFDDWAATAQDQDTVRAIESLLNSLSDEFAQVKKAHPSPDYVLDLASRLFHRQQIAELKAILEASLETNMLDRAEEALAKHRKIELGHGGWIDVLTEEEAIIAAFDQRLEALVTYPDAAGNFFGPALGRDQFVAFLGKDKIGKSYWLQDLAWRAVEQGRNVAYFETGDMSQPQVLRRFGVRAAERPLRPDRYEYPDTMDAPIDTGGSPDLRRVWRDEPTGLTAREAIAAIHAHAGEDSARFKLSCHPNSSISVAGIEGRLEEWERDGWVPDVVVVDYADILAPLNSKAETRDQVNETWKALRSLSQKKHCLVVTATQSDTDAYSAKTLDRANFSEDKRKNAHVTGMVGLNQTDKDKPKGLYRLNWVVLRELEFSEKKCLWTASCLPVGNPCVLSTF